jgi:hypothetical protein
MDHKKPAGHWPAALATDIAGLAGMVLKMSISPQPRTHGDRGDIKMILNRLPPCNLKSATAITTRRRSARRIMSA